MTPTLSPPPSPTPPPPPSNSWGPYSNSGDFRSNALIILAAFFCSVVIILALNFIIRFLFRYNCRNSDAGPPQKPEVDDDESAEVENVTSVVVFSRETKLAGGTAECAICLSEFVEGEGIRVLDICKHGFHVQCVEKWLKVRKSCPTCRCNCCNTSTTSSSTAGLVEEV